MSVARSAPPPRHASAYRAALRALRDSRVPFLVSGAFAMYHYSGVWRETKDLDVLLTPEGLQQFRERFVGVDYEPVPGRSRKFIDRENNVGVDVLVTGHLPGFGGQAEGPEAREPQGAGEQGTNPAGADNESRQRAIRTQVIKLACRQGTT